MTDREIALDTETTGLSPRDGHRIVEIGCVELENRIPTGRTFHVYLNPERAMPEEAFRIHGISGDFLKDKPLFSAVAADFLTFIGESRLVIHNADFDVRFLNAELTHARQREIPESQVFCTLKHARKTFPGAPASLDALCKRFNVDLSSRKLHGALLDAQLLAAMYLELMGGSQQAMSLERYGNVSAETQEIVQVVLEARAHAPAAEELAAHEEFLKKLKSPLWGSA